MDFKAILKYPAPLGRIFYSSILDTGKHSLFNLSKEAVHSKVEYHRFVGNKEELAFA